MKTIEQMYNEAKALVEDRTYNIGEISEKTGLQKTAEGWKPPKNNAENKKTEKEEKSKWKKTTDYLGRDRISLKTKQGGLVSIYETDNPNQKNSRFKVDTGTHTNTFNTMEEAKAFAEKYYGDTKENEPKENNAVKQWEESAKNDARRYKESMVIMQHPDGSVTAIRESSPDIEKAEYNGYEKISLVRPDGSVKRKKETNKENGPKENSVEKKTSSKSLKLPDEKSSFQTDVNRMKKLKKEDYKQYTIQLEKLHSKYPINKWKDLYNKTANDSACRITADTKIKLKNVVQDKTYQIGEISEKTGLQKTANGWVKPKKGTSTKKEDNTFSKVVEEIGEKQFRKNLQEYEDGVDWTHMSLNQIEQELKNYNIDPLTFYYKDRKVKENA